LVLFFKLKIFFKGFNPVAKLKNQKLQVNCRSTVFLLKKFTGEKLNRKNIEQKKNFVYWAGLDK